MSENIEDTQPVGDTGSCRSTMGRMLRRMLIAILALGIFVAGFAVGNDPELSLTAKSVVSTAVDSALTSVASILTQTPEATGNSRPGSVETNVDSAASRPVGTVVHLTDPFTPPPATTIAQTATQVARSSTRVPTATEVPPSNTPIPTATDIPPSSTPVPTVTEVPPSSTPVPTATDIPASPTPRSSSCYPHSEVWVTGSMNVRERPSVNGTKVYVAESGESFKVFESRQGATYCWLRIDKGWMAQTGLVTSTKPQPRIPSAAGSDVRQALVTLSTLVVAPESRCSPYDSDSYPYSQSLEAQIVSRMGGRIYGPYTGTTFGSTSETDIEHIVAKAEAHDSGLCSASAQTRRAFASDLLNLTLASPSVNRHQKSAKDFAEWTPAWNKCWYADRIINVKFKYRLTVDSRERAALERTLLGCNSVDMVFRQQAQPAQQQAQPVQQQSQQQAQPANGNWRQWDTNGNGRITCKEARAAGIAPVHRGHPAYPRMDDRDNDGVVCE